MHTPNKEQIARLVNETFIFRSLDEDIRVQLVEASETRHFQAEEVLIREDEDGTEMMIIESGRVEVSQLGKAGEVSLAILKPGAMLGEVAVITGARRTTTVTALEDTVAIAFSAETIRRITEESPKVKTLLLKLIEGRARHSISINPV